MNTTIYVSPNGNDSNRGDKDTPLASLQRAKDEVRSRTLKMSGDKKEHITVHLAAGVHRLQETLVFEQQDSGHDQLSITWKGEKGTKISSGFALTNWEKCDPSLQDVPSEVRDHVWKMTLPQGSLVNTLYNREGLIPRAKGGAIIPQNFPTTEGDLPEHLYGPDHPIKLTAKNQTDSQESTRSKVPPRFVSISRRSHLESFRS